MEEAGQWNELTETFILILLLFRNFFRLRGHLPEKGGRIEELFAIVEGDHDAVIYDVGLSYKRHAVIVHKQFLDHKPVWVCPVPN